MIIKICALYDYTHLQVEQERENKVSSICTYFAIIIVYYIVGLYREYEYKYIDIDIVLLRN